MRFTEFHIELHQRVLGMWNNDFKRIATMRKFIDIKMLTLAIVKIKYVIVRVCINCERGYHLKTSSKEMMYNDMKEK